MRLRVVGLVSGGKDSWYAVHLAQQAGWEVTRLITVRPGSDESHMYHHPNTQWVRMQAEAAGIPHVYVDAPAEAEGELGPLAAALAGTADVDGFVSGAVASEYQRTRLERIGQETGLKSFAPLWHKDPILLLESMVAAGFDMRVAHTAADGLDASWLGRRIDAVAIGDLAALNARRGVHPSGEGGEYETIVLDAPMFSFRLEEDMADRLVGRDVATWRIRRLKAVSKPPRA
jgi:ABC transporter with metal-binding/Fe-S-binding domain ATP-binding protein